MLLFCLPRRRRAWQAVLGMAASLIILSSGIIACGGGGGGGGGGTPIPGTTAGTYVVTVTGASGAISVPATINVTVQ
jgi:hypothetical protein